ncbi:hypothetical protein T5B8_07578 [Salinisphaera sp. T5B8]
MVPTWEGNTSSTVAEAGAAGAALAGVVRGWVVAFRVAVGGWLAANAAVSRGGCVGVPADHWAIAQQPASVATTARPMSA